MSSWGKQTQLIIIIIIIIIIIVKTIMIYIYKHLDISAAVSAYNHKINGYTITLYTITASSIAIKQQVQAG